MIRCIPMLLLLQSCSALGMMGESTIVENLERDVPKLLATDVLGAFVPEQSSSGTIFITSLVWGLAAFGYWFYNNRKISKV